VISSTRMRCGILKFCSRGKAGIIFFVQGSYKRGRGITGLPYSSGKREKKNIFRRSVFSLLIRTMRFIGRAGHCFSLVHFGFRIIHLNRRSVFPALQPLRPDKNLSPRRRSAIYLRQKTRNLSPAEDPRIGLDLPFKMNNIA